MTILIAMTGKATACPYVLTRETLVLNNHLFALNALYSSPFDTLKLLRSAAISAPQGQAANRYLRLQDHTNRKIL
jgi:hypothetical protein